MYSTILTNTSADGWLLGQIILCFDTSIDVVLQGFFIYSSEEKWVAVVVSNSCLVFNIQLPFHIDLLLVACDLSGSFPPVLIPCVPVYFQSLIHLVQ